MPTRARRVGWTPARQRALVARVAEGAGIVEAARAEGMTPQSLARLTRRAEAGGLRAALERAVRLGKVHRRGRGVPPSNGAALSRPSAPSGAGNETSDRAPIAAWSDAALVSALGEPLGAAPAAGPSPRPPQPVQPGTMDLTHLGRPAPLPASPEEARLDYVPNPRPGRPYLVRFTAPEFTSLCPVTGQPDFAHLVIDYAPGETIVESKSLKLFLASFRNHCGFHEGVTVGIAERLATEMQPLWLRIGGYWYPRGGMPIDVFWQTGAPPAELWVPEQGVPSYRGRG